MKLKIGVLKVKGNFSIISGDPILYVKVYLVRSDGVIKKRRVLF